MSARDIIEITPSELSTHKTISSRAWLCVRNRVYDVTDSLSSHPGGISVVLSQCGLPTSSFESHHSLGMLDSTRSVKFVGTLAGGAGGEPQREEIHGSVEDLRAEAEKILKSTTFAYYETGAEDEVGVRWSRMQYERFWLVPRVLRDVSRGVELGVKVRVGAKVFEMAAPLMFCAVAMQGLADSEHAELAPYRACRKLNLPHMAPYLSSIPLEAYGEEPDLPSHTAPRFLQLYLPKDLNAMDDVLQLAEKLKFDGLFITVDSVSIGKRERDERARKSAGQMGSTAPRTSSKVAWDDSFTWEKLELFMKTKTKLPVVLKGMCRADDALRAAACGVAGIVVSNHGGRNLDSARPTLFSLIEIDTALKHAGVRSRMTLFFDGGIRRGSDIVKALCLGADVVGIGRPFVYGLAVDGERGAARAATILLDEMKSTMKLLGCTSVPELVGDGTFVEASRL